MPNISPLMSESELARKSEELFCAIKFEQSGKAGFESILNACRNAHIYAEAEIGEKRKKSVYFVGFERNEKGAFLASAILEDMRITGMKYLLFANGRIQPKKFAMINMLSCFAAGMKLKNPKAHCSKVIEPFDEAPGTSLTINFGPKDAEAPAEQWLLPCQHLDGFIDLKRKDPISPRERLDAAAVQRNCNLCPLFSSEDFAPIKQVKGAKEYW